MAGYKELKNMSLKSLRWVSPSRMITKAISPVIVIYLAKVLSPADFGIVALCSVFIGLTNLLQGLGFGDYLLKEDKPAAEYVDTAFWSSIAIGVILSILALATSPLIGLIYNEPQLSRILPVFSLVIVANASGSIQLALLQKAMRFRDLFWIELIPVVVSVAVTLPLAVSGFGVWALVGGELCRSVLVNLSYWIAGRWMPRWHFSGKAFKTMFRFGVWVMLEKVEEYTYSNLDRIVLGYFGSFSLLGVYVIARQVFSLLFQATVSPIQNVTFPMLSRMQGSLADLRKGYFKIIRRMMTLSLPITVGVALLASSAMPILFGSKWSGLPMALSILVIGEGLVVSLGAQREVLKILNRPDVYPKSLLINVLFSIVAYAIGAKYGLFVFCVTRVINDLLYCSVQVGVASRFLQFKAREGFKQLQTPVLSSLTMGGLILILGLIFPEAIRIHAAVWLAMIIPIGAMTYIGGLFLLDRNDFFAFKEEIAVIAGLGTKHDIHALEDLK